MNLLDGVLDFRVLELYDKTSRYYLKSQGCQL